MYNREFNKVFDLVGFAFKKGANNERLIIETLSTFLNFLRLQWIPTNIVMESDIIEMLSMRFYGNTKYRNLTLECLTEIVSIKNIESNSQYTQKLVCLFIKILECTFKTYQLRLNSNIQEFVRQSAINKTFVQFFCNFLVAMLKNHQISLEKHSDPSRETLRAALQFSIYFIIKLLFFPILHCFCIIFAFLVFFMIFCLVHNYFTFFFHFFK